MTSPRVIIINEHSENNNQHDQQTWFLNSFLRTSGGPTLYNYSNRTPVTGDVPIIILYIIFLTIFIGFIIIFPGIRKERLTTFTIISTSLFIGWTILVSSYGSSWIISHTTTNENNNNNINNEIIKTYYKSFTKELISATLNINIGLQHFNVSFQGLSPTTTPLINNNKNTNLTQQQNHHFNPLLNDEINYNERFNWKEPYDLNNEYKNALSKGLPYPILTIIEYFNYDNEGFNWGRRYRDAGYYSNILLWTSFSSWLLMNLLIISVPRYGGFQMIITGCLMLSINLIYYLLIPINPPVIRFNNNLINFKFGWSYWCLFAAGTLCTISGCIITILDLIYPNKFSTILEVDYDTPYDRHIIIEDSHDTRKRKNNHINKSLIEEPTSQFTTSITGVGRKILRTLSSKSNNNPTLKKPSNLHDKNKLDLYSHDNQAYNQDLPPEPKSPWRHHYQNFNYPNNQILLRNPILDRVNESTMTTANIVSKSPKSVSFRRQSKLETTFNFDEAYQQKYSKQQQIRNNSTSSSSSDDEHDDQQEIVSIPEFFNHQQLKRNTSSSSTNNAVTLDNNEEFNITHPPLSRINYKLNHIGLLQQNHYLPRASLDSNNSSHNNRRDSNESKTSNHSEFNLFHNFNFNDGSDSTAEDPSSRRSSKEKENLRDGW